MYYARRQPQRRMELLFCTIAGLYCMSAAPPLFLGLISPRGWLWRVPGLGLRLRLLWQRAPVDGALGSVLGLEPVVGRLEVPVAEEAAVRAERRGVLGVDVSGRARTGTADSRRSLG
jgi:hypothetical protein